LWWGHRIPVWYCQDCGEVICETEAPHSCPKCGSTNLEQDPDVLDTWFSSGLWPFSTMCWPEKTDMLKTFYPTDVLVTGRDIIFFWVARMIFTALEFMDERPFKDVFIHGLVLDAQGRKMSKSLGNGVDPLEIIAQYGADTLRFMLVTGNTPGNDLRFQSERLEAARNFANKIWNASRFTLMNLSDYEEGKEAVEYDLADKWILHRLGETAAAVTANLDKYELGEAARAIYDFAWDEFCDWFVELAKNRLYNGTPVQRYTAQTVLVKVLSGTLELLHPFMPFLTEELWQYLPHEGETIMLAKYPEKSDYPDAPQDAEEMALIMDVIRALRNIRSEMGVQPGKKAEIVCITNADNAAVLEKGRAYILQLAHGESLQILTEGDAPEQAAAAHVKGIDLYMPLKGLIDFDKELARLKKELDACEQDFARLSAKLSNEGFLAKAPAEVVAKEKARLEEISVKKAALLARQVLLNG
ncbi:MAG: class I tRNA ligase family protein, partial [Firmicutes bacterium]|nr:class I tRNA ligase family protein [Bacillota bacterium]